MSSPRVLCIGHYTPDCHLRWLADGFALAGCRVVRTGTTDYADLPGHKPWPDEAKPRVRDLPGYPGRGLGDVEFPPVRLDLRFVRQAFSDLEFTADLVYADVTGMRVTAEVALLPNTPSVVRSPEGVRTCDGRVVHVDGIPPGVDLNTFSPGGADFASELSFDEVRRLPFHEQLRHLRAGPRGTLTGVDEFALRAVACGNSHYHSSGHGVPTVFDLHAHTWRHRATEILSRVGLEAGVCPRL